MYENGIVDQSCLGYTASNIETTDCSGVNTCRTCSWPPPEEDDDSYGNCESIDDPWKLYVKYYYAVTGVEQMKAEIMLNGPVSCGVQATGKFDAYDGGIYSENIGYIRINHDL